MRRGQKWNDELPNLNLRKPVRVCRNAKNAGQWIDGATGTSGEVEPPSGGQELYWATHGSAQHPDCVSNVGVGLHGTI
eukprot:6184704-Pleurochrysis_carterae.AAC.1